MARLLFAAGVLALVAALLVRRRRRSPSSLRRRVAARTEEMATALQSGGPPLPFPEVAAHVLLERYAADGMGQAEAVSIAGRCENLDDLVAQVALREGGMYAYAAYLRRFGRTREVEDAATAARGTRFPADPPSGTPRDEAE